MEQESKFYISASVADRSLLMVKNELAKMSAQKQEEFVKEYKRKAKSLGFTYISSRLKKIWAEALFLFQSKLGNESCDDKDLIIIH